MLGAVHSPTVERTRDEIHDKDAMSPRNDSRSAESLRCTEAGALLLDATNGPVFFYETASPNASCSGCGVGLLRQARSDATPSP